MWLIIQHEYPEVFWTTFWSEQLWQAYHVVHGMRNGISPVEARKIGYRLPFSFFKNDWKRSTSSELVAAHKDLYALDFMAKNGGTTFGLEALYLQFLTNRYQHDKNI